jgi:hypothetical protein
MLRLVGLLEAGRRVELRWRMGQPRSLPDAVILGAQKSGTSSLHNYLTQHPGVTAPLRKEVHFFDLNYARGEQWYRAHFGRTGDAGLNLDSSPYYLFHPAVAQRLRAMLPDARLADGTLERSHEHQHFSYLARGRYAEQLERWFGHFPRERFLILRFEDLVADPLAVLNQSLAFVGLPPAEAVDLEARNTRRYPPMAEATAARLREYYEPWNRRLEALLDRPTGW